MRYELHGYGLGSLGSKVPWITENPEDPEVWAMGNILSDSYQHGTLRSREVVLPPLIRLVQRKFGLSDRNSAAAAIQAYNSVEVGALGPVLRRS